MLEYVPGPTGQEFLDDRNTFVKVICGPVGGGKSTVALMELVRRAVEQAPYKGVRRTKFALVRNTMPQLKTTVKPLLDTWLVVKTDGLMGKWRLTENTFEMQFALPDGTTVHSEMVFMPADTPDDVRRLLSFECSAAWVEEGRELDPEVFEALLSRTNRYPSRAAGGVTYPGAIVSTNPPDIGSWWQDKMTNPPPNWRVFMQPPALLEDGSINPEADNLGNLAPNYYENLVEGKTQDWINVYLRNMFGAGNAGQPLYKSTFRKDFHVAKEKLMPVPGSLAPLVIGMDNGLQAAAVITQRDMRGRINVLGECFVGEDETCGVETFLDTTLIPMLTRPEWQGFGRGRIVFALDPACFQRSQVDEKTIAQAIQMRGFAVTKAATNDPQQRLQAVENLLSKQVDGGAALLLDPSCTHTLAALSFGHRYKRANKGQSVTTVEKNHYSHIGDALQYAALHHDGGYQLGVFKARTKARPVGRAPYVRV